MNQKPINGVRKKRLTGYLAWVQKLPHRKDSILLSSAIDDFTSRLDYREMIKGECRDCDKAEECYGCRGAAYQLTGDYLASDPTCWRNQKPETR